MKANDIIDALAEGLLDVPDMVFVFTATGKYLFANNAAAQWLGVERNDLIGYHWSELGFPAEVMGPFTDKISEVAARDQSDWFQMTGSAERGSRAFDISLTPLHTHDGGVMAVLVITRDVTRYLKPAE